MARFGHSVAPEFSVKTVPPDVPYPRAMVLVSGALEITPGLLLLLPRTSRTAAWGLIALLLAIFPANVSMAQHPAKSGLSPTLLLLRLPLQGVLILWAYAYTRK
jgi:uncharacterized membrane protein